MSSLAVAITQTAPTRKRRIGLCIAGCCILIFGVICGLTWETTLNSFIHKTLTLRPDSKVYKYWKSPPLEINVDFYLFNWTNPEDFQNPNIKPILEQVGPYRFQEIPNKVDIRWHAENDTVTYRRKSNFIFKPSDSHGSLSDRITTINPVAVSAAGKAKKLNQVRRGIIDFALKYYKDDISIVRTVDELLFTGYNDLLLDLINTLPSQISDVDVPYDRFGYCYMRNDSYKLTGVYNVFTGADDMSKIGQMNTWNQKKHTGKYESSCGNVYGSAGEFQPPDLKVNGTINVFVAEMCRTMTLDYVETVEVEGIKGYKYHAGLRAVDNGTLYPENKCFCNGRCVPSGVINVTSCWFDAPVFMSYPHFYNADPYYVDAVVGMQPNKEDHEFYVVVEPKTGLALEVAARLQVNLLMEPLPYLKLFKKAPNVVFPIMWFEAKIRLNEEMKIDIQNLQLLSWLGKIIATACLLIGFIVLAWYRYNKSNVNSLQKELCTDIENDNIDNDMERKSLKTNEIHQSEKLEKNEQRRIENSSANKEISDLETQRLKLLYLQSSSFDSGFQNMDAWSHASSEDNSEMKR